MKKALITIFCCAAFALYAEADNHISLIGEVRTCYTFNEGFGSDRLSLRMNGSMGGQFSYAVFQNFNKAITKDNPLAGTDWANVTWKPNERWSITGGKQMSYIGGFEYDARTLDILYGSIWWTNINCFLPGLTGSYNYGNGQLAFEFASSPLSTLKQPHFAYHLLWSGGNIGFWSPRWSTNLMQYCDDGFVHYFVLGNRFTFGPVQIDFDLMHGADTKAYELFKDYTLVMRTSWDVSRMVSLFTKCIYDKTPDKANYTPVAGLGTDAYKLGGGIEFYPAKEQRNVRIHALYYRFNEKNMISLGLSWWFNICKK